MPAIRTLPQGYSVDEGFHTPTHYHNIISPEHRLLWSILERGICDAMGLTGAIEAAKRLQREAYAWIMFPQHLTEFHEFSFEGICEELNMNPTIIRKLIIVQLAKPKDERPDRHRRINIQNQYKARNAIQIQT